MRTRFVLVRHGETAWNLTGQHTGRTDLPLTDEGRAQAATLRTRLAGYGITRVVSSPLQRARETCVLAGLEAAAEWDEDLMEWHYGSAEGRTKAELRVELPGWDIWRHGPPAGETLTELAARGRRVVDRLSADPGVVAVFSHGHFLRVFAATWLGWPIEYGRVLNLSNTGVSLLGDDEGVRVIRSWNITT